MNREDLITYLKGNKEFIERNLHNYKTEYLELVENESNKNIDNINANKITDTISNMSKILANISRYEGKLDEIKGSLIILEGMD